jgi:hypothetical protein
MDGTSGGTMTPPRDENATCDDFAPVIPLRRRQHTLERPVAAEPPTPDFAVADSDAPIPGLDELPSVWQQPEATELLIRPTTAAQDRVAGDREATAATARRGSGSAHVLRRGFIQIAAVSAVLATTAAVVVAAAGGGSHPRPTHAAATLPTSELGSTVTHTAPVKPATHDYARRSATKAATRSHRVTRRSSKRLVRHTTAARESVASSVSPASTVEPSAPTLGGTTAFQHGQAPVHSRATAGSSPASACVPGELGC